MRRRQVRRQTWWLLSALAIIAALAVIVLSARREVRRRRVEAAIGQFQASPSQSAADELARLLATGIPTCRQGERILGLILSPTVTTRSAYPVGIIPTVSIEGPFCLELRRLDHTCATYATLKSGVRLEGQGQTSERAMTVDVLGSGPLLLRCGTLPLSTGTYRGRVWIDCILTHRAINTPIQVWMRLKSLVCGRRRTGGTICRTESYQAQFEIPVAITVVEESRSEQVALVSNPELDESVRQSFTYQRKGDCPFDGPLVGHGEIIRLKWTNVPIAVAFEPVLRLSDGREVHQRVRHATDVGRFRTRTGGSGDLMTDCTRFMIPRTSRIEGYHEAAIVLKPDPNFAYEDPAVKAIWNGTLEFPIHFTVSLVPEPE